MLHRTPLPLLFAVVAALPVALCSSAARADDDGHRFGIAMVLGGGVGGVLHPGPLPGPVGFTDLGAEVFGEVRPWGGFARIDYLSTGPNGLWTTFAFAAGAEYRLFGDTRHTALFLRGGPTFEFLSGQSSGCNVIFLVPSSCNDIGAVSPTFNVTGDMLGVIAGTRVELPLSWFYIAFSANFVPTVAVARQQTGTEGGLYPGPPSGTLELRFDLEAGFRQIKQSEVEIDEPYRSRHRRRSLFQDVAPVPPP